MSLGFQAHCWQSSCTFPRDVPIETADLLLRRVIVPRHSPAIIDHDVRLQRSDIVHHALPPLGVEVLRHVKPDDQQRPVIA